MIKKMQSSMLVFIRQDGFFPLVLLLMILAAYGVGMIGLGFQGDDWHLIWLYYRMGDLSPSFNLTRFSTQWLFQMVMPWLAPIPWQWFLLTLILRWLGGMSLYILFKNLFNRDEIPAGPFSILYCLYPGFLVSYLPLTFLFQFFQPICLFLSFYFMVVWLKADSKRKHWHSTGAIFLATANLLLSEYFYFLELLRPLIIWTALKKRGKKTPTLRQVIHFWRPYLAVFLVILVVRVWTQFASGGRAMLTLDRFTLQPAVFLPQFVQQIIQNFKAILIQPILAALTPQLHIQSSQDWISVIGAVLTAFTFFIHLRKRSVNALGQHVHFLPLLALSLIAFLLAALPFWIAGLKAYFGFEMRNRVALPQGLSFTLLVWACLQLLPVHCRWLRNGLLVFLAGSFALLQLQSAALFRAEWEQRREIMQQVAWRAPALEPGTVILMNDPGFLLSGENSMAAELNWNYVRDPHPRLAEYFIYFNEHRFLSDLPDRQTNQVVERMHMIGSTVLNPTCLLVLHFSESGCLRVLDPQLDLLDKSITSFTRTYLPYAKPSLILADRAEDSLRLDPAIYEKEAEHGWCYYYQKVDLARQLGDWPAAGEYAQQGLELMPANIDSAELRPFIEAQAHNGKWNAARQLTEAILNQFASQNRMLCALWQRMAAGTTASPDREETLIWMTTRTGCPLPAG